MPTPTPPGRFLSDSRSSEPLQHHSTAPGTSGLEGNFPSRPGVCTLGRMVGKLTTLVGCWVALTCLLQAQAPPIYVPLSIQQHRLIYNVRPVYPKLAIQAHIQGTVKLRSEERRVGKE